MEIKEQDIKRIALIILVALLAIITFLIIKPIFLSIFGGLLLAYIFYPVYIRILKYLKSKNLSASVITVIVLILIFLPLWLVVPILIQRIFEIFSLVQNLNIGRVAASLFPGIPEDLSARIVTSVNTATANLSSLILNSLTDSLVNFMIIAAQFLIAGFVFFFALRDEEKLRNFVAGLSPLNKKQELLLVKQFKDITNSIVFGQVIVGFLQGVFAGIGYLIFGVDNVLVLTILSIFFAIIPILGVGFVYIPVAVLMFVNGQTALAVGFLIYCLLIVSTSDNIMRVHIVSRKAKLSQVVVLMGMIGGLLFFGFLGLVLGPLILAYFITILEAYKEKRLSSFFNEE